mmetsp:Transcript_128170/g.292896  ORF Transcript_128170/g.292896 Transcript_128170/m.292896 type:complete len:185 (+) Transcript_128170:231-785(+)
MDRVVDQTMAPGDEAFGSAVIPQAEWPEFPSRLVALDGVRFPDNAGSILRTAVVMGFDGAVMLPGTVDPYNWKTVAANEAVHLGFPLKSCAAQEFLEMCDRNRLLPLVAHTDGISVESLRVPPEQEGFALVLGSEASGPSQEYLDVCTRVKLPMADLVNSLNVSVAGGILMHSLLNHPGFAVRD